MLILVSLGMSISVFFVLKKLLDFYAHVCALSYCYNKEETEVKEYKIKVEVVNQHGNTLLFIVVFWPNFLMYTFMFFLVYFLKKVTKAFTSILTGKSPIIDKKIDQ